MHKIICITMLFLSFAAKAQVGIGTNNPQPSAQLDVNSNNKGFLPPRMTIGERSLIQNPSAGLIIYNMTFNLLEFFNGLEWIPIGTFIPPNSEGLFGGSTIDRPESLIQTNDFGSVVLSRGGTANGTLAGLTNNGATDIWVMKLDQGGSIIWQKLFGGAGSDIGNDIKQTTDSGYIIVAQASVFGSGTFTGLSGFGASDIVVIKLDQAGNTLWQRVYGANGSDVPTSVIQTSDGDYLICGSTTSTDFYGQTSLGGTDGFVMKIDSDGDRIWSLQLGGTGTDLFSEIDETSNFEFYVAGNSSSPTIDGNTNFGATDMWVVKIATNNSVIFQKFYGSSGSDDCNAVASTADGGFILGGQASSTSGTFIGASYSGGGDVALVKIDNLGVVQWKKLIGGMNSDFATDIVESYPGSYVVVGSSQSSNSGLMTGLINHGGIDSYVMRIEGSGNIIWQHLFGGLNDERDPYVIKTMDNNFIFAAESGSSNTGNLAGFVNNGVTDLWILKILGSSGLPL